MKVLSHSVNKLKIAVIKQSKNRIKSGLRMVHERLYVCLKYSISLKKKKNIFLIWVRTCYILRTWQPDPSTPKILTLIPEHIAKSEFFKQVKMQVLFVSYSEKELTLHFWKIFKTLNSLDRLNPLFFFFWGGSRYPIHYMVAFHHSAISFGFTGFNHLAFMTGVIELKAVLEGRNGNIC